MHKNASGLPSCLSLQFALEGMQKPPNFVDFFIGPEETDRDGMNMGLLPIFQV